MAQCIEDLRLAFKGFFDDVLLLRVQVGVKEHLLEGNFIVEPLVNGLIDGAHAALPYELDNVVAALNKSTGLKWCRHSFSCYGVINDSDIGIWLCWFLSMFCYEQGFRFR
jgi:hypothetical protein